MDKIKTLNELLKIRQQLKNDKKIVVWTNGCFDILHAGHVLYLQAAKKLGDILIVGLNTDASVRKTKGESRPIVNEKERGIVLSGLNSIDYIVYFNDDSPFEMIEMLKPDVYVKGGDYTIDTINQQERRLVEKFGAKIELLPGVEGMSTTAVIEKVKSLCRGEHS